MAESCLNPCVALFDNPSGEETYVACLESCFRNAGWTRGSNGLPVAAAIVVAAGLVCFSAMFSGLTLGLLSLDLVGLRILEKAGDPKEKEYARKIIPVRQRGNLLLCTLLLGNTVVNSAISIVLSGVTGGVFGLITSTFVIMLLGEIIPQAACSRYSLIIGSFAVPIVRVFMALFIPVTFPIAALLDWVLGRDIGTVYNQEELKRLIELHVEDPDAQKESRLTVTDHKLLTGAFEYKKKLVRDVMTRIDEAFMLEKNMKLDFPTLSKIYISGCSRIPIYEGERHNVVGLLFVKDLILVDPDDELDVTTVMKMRSRPVARVYDNVTLDKVFTNFMANSNHMLIVHRPPQAMLTAAAAAEAAAAGRDGEAAELMAAAAAMEVPSALGVSSPVTGLITLEDVLEEIIKSEIYDESDEAERIKVEGRSRDKERSHRQDVSVYLNLFHKMHGSKLSPQEAQAVQAFLAASADEFRQLAAADLPFKGLVRTAEVIERGVDEGDESHHGGLVDTAEPPGGARWWLDVAAGGQLLYQRDRPASHFTLILQGKVLIRTGAEGFELDMGPWSVIGNKALTSSTYVPDFDAAPVPPYRLLRISRASYLAALDALRLQQASQYQAMKAHVRAAGGSLSGANVPAASAPALAQLAAVSTPAASAIPAAGAPSPRALLMPPPPPAGGGSGVTPAALLTAGGGGGAPVVAAAAIRPSASASDIPVTVGGPSSPSHIQLTDVGAGSNRKGFNPKALDSLGALVFSAASAALRRNVSSRSVPDAPSPFANYRATSPELLLASATGSAGGRDDNHTSITIDEVALQRSYSNPNEMVSTSAAEAARAAHAEGAARPMRRSADPLGMDGNDDAPSSAFVIEDEDAPLFTSAPSSLPADRSRWQSSSSN